MTRRLPSSKSFARAEFSEVEQLVLEIPTILPRRLHNWRHINSFLDTETLFPRFDLPMELPA
jgi:hypothetical protein